MVDKQFALANSPRRILPIDYHSFLYKSCLTNGMRSDAPKKRESATSDQNDAYRSLSVPKPRSSFFDFWHQLFQIVYGQVH